MGIRGIWGAILVLAIVSVFRMGFGGVYRERREIVKGRK